MTGDGAVPLAATAEPPAFTAAVASLRAASVRAEVELEEVPAPQRLAPWSYAIGARVVHGGDEVANGRLILLHDPAGHDAWDGVFRLVTYVSADVDADMAGDPLLADVGWSWLLEALDARGAGYTAAGGTVTQTSSTRFGDLAGPAATAEVELRASWTALDGNLGAHLLAWCDLLCTTAGLPPEGVALLPRQP